MAFVPVYIFILGFTIVIDFCAGILMENSKGRKRKLYLILSIISNCLILGIFKYYNFFIENFNYLFSAFQIDLNFKNLNIILPIGLSFHTFQAMSYTIEVYRGKQKAERHFGIYSLYVMFYPQLVAGPIERPQNILHQLKQKVLFNYENVVSGLILIGWGIFRKVVVADRLAIIVDSVYNEPLNQNGFNLLMATFFFSLQIYFDFSSYSDIAIGTAKVMGVDLIKNFDSPYTSRNIQQFWSRWHISLSTWFRDYLYIPLGGNKVSVFRWIVNVYIVFLISGIWHGANWTFVIWGFLHGTYIIFFRLLNRHLKADNGKTSRFYAFIQILTTFSLVSFSWIFFRAISVKEALFICKKIFTDIFNSWQYFMQGHLFTFYGIERWEYGVVLLSIIMIFIIEIFYRKYDFIERLAKWKIWQRWAIYFVFFLMIVFLGVNQSKQFIYFQF